VSKFNYFLVGSTLYLLWIGFFLKYRRRLDYQRFAITSKENQCNHAIVLWDAGNKAQRRRK
jgi:ATP-binding cassette subfamily B protein